MAAAAADAMDIDNFGHGNNNNSSRNKVAIAARSQVNVRAAAAATLQQQHGISIRGIAGPYAIVGQNFAPGTTPADVESAMTPIGGEMIRCEVIKTQPFLMMEMVFASREGAERVIDTFNDKTVRSPPPPDLTRQVFLFITLTVIIYRPTVVFSKYTLRSAVTSTPAAVQDSSSKDFRNEAGSSATNRSWTAPWASRVAI